MVPPSIAKRSKLDANDHPDPLQPDNDGTPRHQIGTTACKCFNNFECKGEIVHHDHNDQLCQISHSDGDREQTWHNEVKNHLQSTRNPKKVKKQQINQILTKLAPTEFDADSHSPGFDIASVQAITAVRFRDATATATAAFDEDIRLCLQTLGSDSTTPEKQALGRFTCRKLKH